jgi:hypothetical protein
MLQGDRRTPAIAKGFQNATRGESAGFKALFERRGIERERFTQTKQDEVFEPHDREDEKKNEIMASVLLFVTQNPRFVQFVS